MNVQYLTDNRGRRTGVFIPIKEWEMLQKQLNIPAESVATDDLAGPTKESVLAGIKEAVGEVKLHRQGKIKMQSARDFLNEL